jgi:hypothetical protein
MAPVIVQQPRRLVRQNDDVVFRPHLQMRVADRTSAISQNVKFRDEASRYPFGAFDGTYNHSRHFLSIRFNSFLLPNWCCPALLNKRCNLPLRLVTDQHLSHSDCQRCPVLLCYRITLLQTRTWPQHYVRDSLFKHAQCKMEQNKERTKVSCNGRRPSKQTTRPNL